MRPRKRLEHVFDKNLVSKLFNEMKSIDGTNQSMKPINLWSTIVIGFLQFGKSGLTVRPNLGLVVVRSGWCGVANVCFGFLLKGSPPSGHVCDNPSTAFVINSFSLLVTRVRIAQNPPTFVNLAEMTTRTTQFEDVLVLDRTNLLNGERGRHRCQREWGGKRMSRCL